MHPNSKIPHYMEERRRENARYEQNAKYAYQRVYRKLYGKAILFLLEEDGE